VAGSSGFVDHSGAGRQWYDLFSRGARDWLRHNDKVRAAVRDKLPELIANSDLLPRSDSTVQVPVKFLEHARLKLRDPEQSEGVGQGEAKPGDRVDAPTEPGAGKGAGGNDEGGFEFVLELKIDDIVEWLWEELKLPNLKVKQGAVRDDDYTREGWSRRGVRSRLDRRRSLKEAIKRRAVQDAAAPPFTNEDLRYRQLALRQRPATEAVVYFAMDVSSSMGERDRQLAKTFFFWVVQGLRRQYLHIEPVFVAHTVEAWEFPEAEFFQVTGSGGTVASTAFQKVVEIAAERYDPGRFNSYVFYASDGANFQNDREPAAAALAEIGKFANFVGYVETAAEQHQPPLETETALLFEQLQGETGLAGRYALTTPESVWDAIRAFFSRPMDEAA
jgi:uncharacterized sporulation protein YeaH/YhbH (DUF444 family)